MEIELKPVDTIYWPGTQGH